MKKIMFMAYLFSFAGPAQAQKVIAPAPVQAAFEKKYPQASKVTWEKEKGNYEANWGGKSGEDHSAQFSPEGRFLEIADAIPVSALPSGVIAYIKQHYGKAKITEAAKVTDAQGKTTYEAEVGHKEVRVKME